MNNKKLIQILKKLAITKKKVAIAKKKAKEEGIKHESDFAWVQDSIDTALTELLEDDLLEISVDDTGEFYYSLNEDGKKVAETILGINKIDPEVNNA